MLIYATTAELADYTGKPAPADGVQLLRFASMLVRRSTSQAIYATDPDGFPTDTAMLDAFRDATCAQANAWSVNNIDPAAGGAGVTGTVVKKSLGSASVDYSTDAGASSERTRLASGGLAFEAYLILQNAGLISASVISDYPVGIDNWVSA